MSLQGSSGQGSFLHPAALLLAPSRKAVDTGVSTPGSADSDDPE